VVRDHLGVILRAPERLDPFRCVEMSFGAICPRNLAVRDVTDEQVLERVLSLPVD
jgi:hypothetical protein